MIFQALGKQISGTKIMKISEWNSMLVTTDSQSIKLRLGDYLLSGKLSSDRRTLRHWGEVCGPSTQPGQLGSCS